MTPEEIRELGRKLKALCGPDVRSIEVILNFEFDDCGELARVTRPIGEVCREPLHR